MISHVEKKLLSKKLPIVVAAALSLAACGGGSGTADAPKLTADQQAVADTLATTILDDDSNAIDKQADAQCWADKIVAGIPLDRLEELGVNASGGTVRSFGQADEKEANIVTESLYSCIDVKAAMIEQMEAGGEMTAGDAECVVGKISDDDIKAIMISGILDEVPDGDVIENFMQAGQDCQKG